MSPMNPTTAAKGAVALAMLSLVLCVVTGLLLATGL